MQDGVAFEGRGELVGRIAACDSVGGVESAFTRVIPACGQRFVLCSREIDCEGSARRRIDYVLDARLRQAAARAG